MENVEVVRRKRIDPEARKAVRGGRARWNDWDNGSADNVGQRAPLSAQKEAEDMTAPTTRATLKIALDQRASSRHDGYRTDSGPSRGDPCRRAIRPKPTKRPRGTAMMRPRTSCK